MLHHMNRVCSVLLFVFLVETVSAQLPEGGQLKTVDLTYNDAVKALSEQSLPLVAAHFDIDISEGELKQARVWNNPHFNWNSDLYSLERNEYLNQNNQRLIQVDILFSIAGKHTRAVKLAKINVELNRLMFEDVKRSLIYELGVQFYTLHALQQKEALYEIVLSQFKTLIDAYEVQFRVGAIPGNELIRLKSELLALQTTIINNQNEANEAMSQIRSMLNLRSDVRIRTVEPMVSMPDPATISFTELLAKAQEVRPDYLLQKKEIDYNVMNVKLQRSSAVPDVLFGYQPHDRGSNYVRPSSGIVVEIDIPLFDRNQGNIHAAKAKLEQARVNQEYAIVALDNELSSALYKMLNTDKALDNYNEAFLDKLKLANENARENFNKKNISMLEYIDIQRIYIQTMHEYIDLKSQGMMNVKEVNFTVGTEIY